MNITELLSEYLKQGKTVDIPGIGSFCAQQVSAYYDAASSTFYPTQQRISFSSRMQGGSSFANYIAEKDCVSIAIGERTWANYVEAMKAQLESDGQLVLHGLGTITRGASGLEFVAEEGLNDDNPYMKAVKGVKQYASQPNANPFTRFDSIPQPEPEPVVVPVAPVVESVPETEETDVPVETETPSVAEVADTVEAEAPVQEPAPVVAENSTEATQEEPESIVEQAHEPSIDEEVVPKHEESVSAVAEMPSEPVVEDSPIAEPAANIADQSPLEGLKELERMQSESSENNANSQNTVSMDESEKKPRKKKTWLWILLVVLILLLGAGGFLWKTGKLDTLLGNNAKASNQDIDIEKMVSGSEGSEPTASVTNVDDAEAGEMYGDGPSADIEADVETESEEAAQGSEPQDVEETATSEKTQPVASEKQTLPANTNLFTYSTDGLIFDQNELDVYASEVMSRMDSYITNYATLRRYSKAVELLKTKSAEYTRTVLDERLGHPKEIGFHQLLPYNDYVRNYNMPSIKGRKANRTKVLIQAELMESKLEELLNQVISENNIEQDAAPAVAPRSAQPVSTASYSSHSKKGYDIIAGFFVTKAYADRMATNLKKKGCDAYIIEVNQGYYVSMGSAESRTKAEALYAHIKEWYKGDISIKKF